MITGMKMMMIITITTMFLGLYPLFNHDLRHQNCCGFTRRRRVHVIQARAATQYRGMYSYLPRNTMVCTLIYHAIPWYVLLFTTANKTIRNERLVRLRLFTRFIPSPSQARDWTGTPLRWVRNSSAWLLA
jgi:hypothetical protein